MTEQASERPGRSPRLLWYVVLLMLAAAALLWGASALRWSTATYRTPFSGDVQAGATGAVVRPELVPLALAALAAVAAVLAAGGWLRRVIGALTAACGALLAWRVVSWYAGGPQDFEVPGVPPGSVPIGTSGAAPFGPVLVVLAALALLGSGVLVAARAHLLPGMGARYSAPGARKEEYRGDPDKRLWEALDEGDDPTEDR